MTQEELARRAGMSLKGMGDIERGAIPDPHYSSLSKIAEGLGVSVGELLEEEPVLSGKAEASEAGRPAETAEAGESLDYRKLHLELGDRLVGQLKETLAMLADVLPTDDYAEFVKYPFEEQRWRIETAERLNALA
jgi:transcriptional regulator with XRE-family HTH domain